MSRQFLGGFLFIRGGSHGDAQTTNLGSLLKLKGAFVNFAAAPQNLSGGWTTQRAGGSGCIHPWADVLRVTSRDKRHSDHRGGHRNAAPDFADITH